MSLYHYVHWISLCRLALACLIDQSDCRLAGRHHRWANRVRAEAKDPRTAAKLIDRIIELEGSDGIDQGG